MNDKYKRPREHIYDKEKDSIVFTGTRDDSDEEFKSQMFQKYERIETSPDIEYKVQEIVITSITEVNSTTTQIIEEYERKGIQRPEVLLGLDDLFAVFRRVPSSHREFTIVALYEFDSDSVRFHEVFGMNFGLKTVPPYNLTA